jgi:hypothetical protein
MLRELCYDQDLYLQTALIVLPPDLLIVSILDRFGLLAYFSGDLLGTSYEGAQLGSMVEEVFYVKVGSGFRFFDPRMTPTLSAGLGVFSGFIQGLC